MYTSPTLGGVYTPPGFAIDHDAALAVIDTCDLAAVVVTDPEGGFEATWLPLLRDGHRLLGHVAKANPIWRHEGPAMAMFRTIDGYVSPSWYASKHEHGKVVPTWNYVAVHAHGPLRAVADAAFLRDVVARLTRRHETRIGSDWQVSDAPADFIDSMLRNIVGIEITLERVEGKAKLSQNRSAADVAGVIAANPNAMGAAVAHARDTAR